MVCFGFTPCYVVLDLYMFVYFPDFAVLVVCLGFGLLASGLVVAISFDCLDSCDLYCGICRIIVFARLVSG